MLIGPPVKLSDEMLMDSFVDLVSAYERTTLQEDLQVSLTNTHISYMPVLLDKLVDILSQFGCREVPTPLNLPQLVLRIARHEFMVKPLGALYARNSGVPENHRGFWNTFSVQELFTLYTSLNATPCTVIARIEVPEQNNSAQARVFGYLIRYIGNMRNCGVFLDL